MYKLYVFIGNDSFVGRYFTEQDLMQGMVDIVNKYHIYNFHIIEALDNKNYDYRWINNKKDFEDLLNEFKTTKDIKDYSAIELKRMILRRIKKC